MGFPDYRIQGVDIFTYWIRWKRNYLRNLINKLTIFFFVYFGFYYNSTIQSDYIVILCTKKNKILLLRFCFQI